MTFGETEPSEQRGGEGSVPAVVPGKVTFSRSELDRILGLYGRMVAAGEWRDYAIDFLKDRAVFSVFRRASEVPLYRIEKNPRLARRQGAYSVVSATGRGAAWKSGFVSPHTLTRIPQFAANAFSAA